MLGVILGASGCSHVVIATGTTLGLKATPGDGETRPPQVTFGYKRAELAMVPTKRGTATKCPAPGAVAAPIDPADGSETPAAPCQETEAFSTLASFFFETQWFGRTEVESFIATGHAAKEIQGVKFAEGFSQVAKSGQLAPSVAKDREALIERWRGMNNDEAAAVLNAGGITAPVDGDALDTLRSAIDNANPDQLREINQAVAIAQ
jgi:hypothetical protein